MTVLWQVAVNKLQNSKSTKVTNYKFTKLQDTSFLNQRFYILFVYNMQSTMKVQFYSHGDFLEYLKLV